MAIRIVTNGQEPKKLRWTELQPGRAYKDDQGDIAIIYGSDEDDEKPGGAIVLRETSDRLLSVFSFGDQYEKRDDYRFTEVDLDIRVTDPSAGS